MKSVNKKTVLSSPLAIPYWRLSSFYAFYFAALGSLLPFWSLYLKHCGFDASQIGELSALLVGTKVIAPNIGGWISDHTGKSLRLVRWAMFLAAVLFLCFLLAKSYANFALVTIAFSLFWNAALPQFEAAALFHVQAEPLRYPKIRLWGSVGFIVAVLGVGQLLDYQSITLLPVVITGLLAVTWLTALITPEAHVHKPHQKTTSVWRTVFSVNVMAFLVVYCLTQIAHSPYYIFFTIYLKQYHYTASLTGLLWALAVVAEIVLFLLMRPLLQRVSFRKVLLLSLLLSAVRWYLTARYAHYLVVIVVAQILHAATFGSLHVVAMHLIQNYFGKHHQGKGQALYTSFSYGLGGIAGSYVSGHLWGQGAEQLFLWAAGCCAIAFFIALFWVYEQPSVSIERA